ncbi:ABC transporter ATP-binding protein [Paenalkalicoccus suaedae]|uniref:ABC transporter ATP-binding protein n=1 Tax=Paenalkalicoccus suaedae TaxID=2592382 RepID=A0A859FB80_9BACI|nr:ABC transporter ATP-binding protein [Paenalkalicoccus suaedae]QKS69804.1 ABC transporter ATP-binding protein [Paenalkalicoccus suaedae]
MVVARKLVKRYGEKTVVNDVSVTIKKGAITSFIGPNGAGKSTLLSMVSRLILRDEGDVHIDGQDIKSFRDRDLAKKVAILRQSNFMNVRLSIRDLVSFGRFPYSQGRLTKEDWEHVDQAIAYMELTDMQDKFIDTLSGGQRQRAFIAMVLAQDTDYILLDEPLNNLDMKHSVQMMKVLRDLTDDLGKTVVLVLHDINFASCYSDFIVAMKDGEIVQEGPKCDIIQQNVLQKIYDIDFHIQDINNQRICVYFS